MIDLASILKLALSLVASGDPELMRIIGLSVRVTLSAVALGCLIGVPFGAALVVLRFPGRGVLTTLINAFMGLPPVVVGLAVYLMLSRSGPLRRAWPALHADRDDHRANRAGHPDDRGAFAAGLADLAAEYDE